MKRWMSHFADNDTIVFNYIFTKPSPGFGLGSLYSDLLLTQFVAAHWAGGFLGAPCC